LATIILFSGGESTKVDINESAAIPRVVAGITQKEEGFSSEADRKIFIEKTGFDMMEIAEKAGFIARFDVDNGAGPYINLAPH